MRNLLRKRKPIVYISLGIYLFLIALIIFESCLPSGISGNQSNIFAQISAWFINNTTQPITPKSIDPIEILEVADSTYLGKGEDGISNIVIGTTSLVSVPYKYPVKADKYDVYNQQYFLEYPVGNKDDYSVSLSSRTGKDDTYIVDMRITSNNMNSDLYQININIADIKFEYKFHIVPLATPTSYESKISKDTLKIGETVKVDTKFLDDKHPDTYLRRYLDESKIERLSLNPSVATIDKYGVIHGISEGSTTIKYGTYEFPITVSNEHIVKPATNTLNLSVAENSKEQPSLLDYDYVFNGTDKSNDYSSLIYASFSDTTLEDQSISWECDDDLKVKLAPYKYDENGYPVYVDDLNRPCVRVSGYRKKGEVTIKAISNADNTISKDIVLNVDEALPAEMDVDIKNLTSIKVNEQKVITGTFNPKNVNNRKIHIDVSDANLVSVSNNDSTSVTLSGLKTGNVHITITSLANPSLKKEFDISVTAKDKINDDNYADFHTFVRKAAGHFFLFLVTAVFGTIFFYTYIDNDKYIYV